MTNQNGVLPQEHHALRIILRMKYSLLSVQANGLLAMEGRSIFAAAMKSVDKILAIIETELPKVGVECLLIGGFAVNYYGYTPNTRSAS